MASAPSRYWRGMNAEIIKIPDLFVAVLFVEARLAREGGVKASIGINRAAAFAGKLRSYTRIYPFSR